MDVLELNASFWIIMYIYPKSLLEKKSTRWQLIFSNCSTLQSLLQHSLHLDLDGRICARDFKSKIINLPNLFRFIVGFEILTQFLVIFWDLPKIPYSNQIFTYNFNYRKNNPGSLTKVTKLLEVPITFFFSPKRTLIN